MTSLNSSAKLTYLELPAFCMFVRD